MSEIKDLRSAWLRKSALFMNIIANREADIKRLKESGGSKTIIDRIDKEIDELVNFYNSTEEVINALYLETIVLNTKIRLKEAEVSEVQKFVLELLQNNSEIHDKFMDLILKYQSNLNDGNKKK